ncbi:MAG: hypothetical protein H6923_04465 [Alphaproteobacteria bacterium]|nr:hypothetical protein [Alphaproteobacteria bacterium]
MIALALDRLARRQVLVLAALGALVVPLLAVCLDLRPGRAVDALVPRSHPFAGQYLADTLEPAGTVRLFLEATLANGARIMPPVAEALERAIAEADHASGVRIVRRGADWALYQAIVPQTAEASFRQAVEARLSGIEAPGEIRLEAASLRHALGGLPRTDLDLALLLVLTLALAGAAGLALLRSRVLVGLAVVPALAGALAALGFGHLLGLDLHVLTLPLAWLALVAGLATGFETALACAEAVASGAQGAALVLLSWKRLGRPLLISLGALGGSGLVVATIGFPFLATGGVAIAAAAVLFLLVQLLGVPLLAARFLAGGSAPFERAVERMNRTRAAAHALGRTLGALGRLTVASSLGLVLVAALVAAGFYVLGRSDSMPAAIPGPLSGLYTPWLQSDASNEGMKPALRRLVVYVREDLGGCALPASMRVGRQLESYLKSLDYAAQVDFEEPIQTSDAKCRLVPLEIVPLVSGRPTRDALLREIRQFRDEAGKEGDALLLAGGSLAMDAAADETREARELPVLLAIWIGGGLLLGLGYRRIAPILAWTGLAVAYAAGAYALLGFSGRASDPVFLASLAAGAFLVFHGLVQFLERVERHRAAGFDIGEAVEHALEERVAAHVAIGLACLPPLALWMFSESAVHGLMGATLAFAAAFALVASVPVPAVILVLTDHDFLPPREPAAES